MEQVNQSGKRNTTQQPGQAPFGCKWFSGWTDGVKQAEADGQLAQVVYKKGKLGNRTFDGLGASQLKEVLYLEL